MTHATRKPATAPDPDFVPLAPIPEAALLPHVHALLDGTDIRYMIANENVQNLLGFGATGMGYNVALGMPVICVDPARVEEARELLAPLLGPAPDDAE